MMNPYAPEFLPPTLVQNNKKMSNAWSNPAKSVHIAKLPPRSNVNEPNVCSTSSNLAKKVPRVMPLPVHSGLKCRYQPQHFCVVQI